MFSASQSSGLKSSQVNVATDASSVKGALTALSVAMLLSSLSTSIANVGLPTFTQVFEASFQDVQWIVLAYLLAVTTLIVSAGRLGDLFGRRRLLLTGIVLFVAASLACSLAPWLWLLVVARAIQGFGAAIMMALTMAFVAGTVSKERIGSAMGLLGVNRRSRGTPCRRAKGTPFLGSKEAPGGDARSHGVAQRIDGGRLEDLDQARFLKRQLSLPVSTMSQ